MPPIHPRSALRAASRSFQPAKQSASKANGRPFSITARRGASSSSSHESQYDPPSGWLWGVKPGEKYKNEGWEKPFFWGFCGSLVLFAVVQAFKPDTS